MTEYTVYKFRRIQHQNKGTFLLPDEYYLVDAPEPKIYKLRHSDERGDYLDECIRNDGTKRYNFRINTEGTRGVYIRVNDELAIAYAKRTGQALDDDELDEFNKRTKTTKLPPQLQDQEEEPREKAIRLLDELKACLEEL